MKLENGKTLPIQYRNVCIVRDPAEGETDIRAMVDEEKRSVRLSFSSEAPVLRDFGNEVLSHEKKAVRLSRLNTSAPLLLDHDSRNQIGVVDYASINNGRGEAVVRFSKSARGEEVWNDVKDGIRSLVSVGYRIHKTEVTDRNSDTPTVRVTDWEPYEVSIVSVPADVSVGVGRSDQNNAWPVEVRMLETAPPHQDQPIKPEKPMSEPITIDTTHKAGNRTYQTYDAYLAEMRSTAEALKSDAGSLADALSRNIDPQNFAGEVFKKNPPAPITVAPDTVRSIAPKEKRTFSLQRLISGMANGNLDGFEREIADELVNRAPKDRVRQMKPGSVLVPDELFSRAATAGVATAGGYTVAEELQAVIPLLNNDTLLSKLGITRMTGLQGNIVFPVLSSGTTVYWVSETEALTDSQPVWASKNMVPHRVGGSVPFSTQLLAQSSVSIEQFMRNELITRIDIEVDRAGLLGSGIGGEPVGVANAGISTFSVSATPTWAEMVAAETAVQTYNAVTGPMAWAVTPASAGWLKSTPKVASTASMFMMENGTMNGYPVQVSNQVASDIAYFGAWGELVYGEWQGTEVIVDPYALKKSGQVEVTVNKLCDFLLKQTRAIVASSTNVLA